MTQLMTSHDLTTLVMTELMTLTEIDHQKIDMFGKLPVLQVRVIIVVGHDGSIYVICGKNMFM
jgi:hypothetical protein